MTHSDPDRQELIRLRELLSDSFNLEELRLLCFDLGLDYENLAGGTKGMKAQNLITYLQRRGKLQRLLDVVKSQRPNVDWPDFSANPEDYIVVENKGGEPESGDQVGGHKIEQQINSEGGNVFPGPVSAARDVIGGDQIFQGDVTFGRDRRDDQYEIALNWDGKTRMRGYDLAERDLSGLNLANSDLRGANLRGADLRKTDLSGSDLRGADLARTNLSSAQYTKLTSWPDKFDPKTAGAILVNDDSNPIEEIPGEDNTFDTYTDAKTGLVMMRIPAGDFIYGEDSRLEYLPEFWIARTPVTNAHYFKFVRETGYDSPEHWEGKSPREKIAEHPVVHVSYEDAAAFANWAGMDLPDEKEWEKAARGTDGRIYPWGNEWKEGYCNTKEAGIGITTPAGRYSPRGDSPYGCVDMAGNVYDWTASWYDEEEGWRVLRGGSWSFEQNLAPTTYRDGTPHTDRMNDIGFRLVRRSPPAAAALAEATGQS